MVQLQNSDRLNLSIELGTVQETTDDNDNPILDFQRLIHTRCGRWSLTTGQMIEQFGLNTTDSIIVVVHHKNLWPTITHARFLSQLYEVTQINSDAYQNPTAYDLLSLRKVDKNG